ncbi:MAG TPA: nucleotide exchange factor GrpE [Phycisphaerae bacterium]|jgi:molecular chaperone GrpE|nr:nucleotide exchange factor GrpE [Phycisphaerae bacterium]HOB75219.1 nucleotide exchange factor GrpE [Phycisphaerae bacterium]HOJ54700.1 nucleotide exchange factor GrpE [Phycisphaerae bacterium]HOL25950.1 nucleotide exchange factor GrpE [Phycisphaerae bacterium]HPP19478.1 nucleotide exchange factor GrpE [Phycisphaerae bacterium]
MSNGDEEKVVIPTEEEVARYGGNQAGGAGDGEPAGAEPAQAETTESAPEVRSPEVEWKEIALRARAELSNYQKRAEKDRAEAIRYANGGLVKDLLPVLDDLERVIQSAEETPEASAKAVVEGVKLILDMFRKVLRQYNVEAIPAEGELFDPQVHEAMMERPSDHAERVVLQELSKGYKLHDRVLRPSKVIVSKPMPAAEAAESESAEGEG